MEPAHHMKKRRKLYWKVFSFLCSAFPFPCIMVETDSWPGTEVMNGDIKPCLMCYSVVSGAVNCKMYLHIHGMWAIFYGSEGLLVNRSTVI